VLVQRTIANVNMGRKRYARLTFLAVGLDFSFPTSKCCLFNANATLRFRYSNGTNWCLLRSIALVRGRKGSLRSKWSVSVTNRSRQRKMQWCVLFTF